MLTNKKGAALLQVLLVTAILAGMAAMLLRASLSRSTSVRNTRQNVSKELLIEACQAEINIMWSYKKPKVFQRDLAGCWMNCNVPFTEDENSDTWRPGDPYTSSKCHTTLAAATRTYTCSARDNGVPVTATFLEPSSDENKGPEGQCKLTYSIGTAALESAQL